MRYRLDMQLDTLNTELIKMGALCEEAIGAAIKSLLADDNEVLKKVFEAEELIDQKERDIEDICMKILLQQQPVAGDLRKISSALKMISDMERIGDQAEDIAEILEFVGVTDLRSVTHIADMADSTIRMVTESVDSFVKKDLDMALDVIKYDDVVDNLFLEVKKELTGVIAKNPESGEICLDLLMIAKYFERIGDHATNIAEWVCYAITGKHPEV